jgi:hypothetical protein
MSRVERTENQNEKRELRQAERSRGSVPPPKTTPTKAEGELTDIEQALENQKE